MLSLSVKRWVLAAVCGLAGAGALAANVNYRALLVGVSEYPGLDAKLQLEGPRNDVTRMREVLLQRGVPAKNITVLADGVPSAKALPTRANILGQLDQLARTATPNDYIVLHMAGHGSQEPVSPGSPFARDEPDGLFEIFLPRDVGAWQNLPNGQGGAIRNAIIDHEIRAAVDRMTAAGAFVWGIFDACHSATLVRSAGPANDEMRMRQVLPQDLGVPLEAMDRASARPAPVAVTTAAAAAPAPLPASGGARGGSVFFYAAQTSEPTPEMRLPAGHPNRTSHGLFSFTMMQALEGGAGMTYRQLSQYVLTRYGGMNEARVTPLFSGTALDSAVMGQDAAPVRQWRLTEARDLTVGAGALAGLEEGAVLAILPTAIAATTEALGYAQVTKTELHAARLEPVAYGDAPAKTSAELKAGTVARLVRPAVKFSLAVGTDLSRCAKPCAFDGPLAKLRDARSGVAAMGAQVQWVAPGQSADLRLTAIGNRLWLMPPTLSGQQACATLADANRKATCEAQLERSVTSITLAPTATADNAAEAIGRALHAAARSANLMRIASALAASPVSAQIRTTIQITGKNGRKTPYTPGQVPRVEDGDKLVVTLENTGRTSADVTALYLDSHYGVTALFPRGMGASNRLEPAAADSFELEITSETLGLERLAVIAVEAEKKSERADFSYLAQPTLASQTVTRGTGADTEGDALFRDAGFAEYATRGGRPAAVSARTGMQVFSWQVVR